MSDPRPQPQSRHASSEGKTPWTYKTEEFEDILHGNPDILNGQDEFQKSWTYEKHLGNSLLKQVCIFLGRYAYEKLTVCLPRLFGQCISLGTDIAFATNAECAIAVVRIHPTKAKSESESDGRSSSNLLEHNPSPAEAPSV